MAGTVKNQRGSKTTEASRGGRTAGSGTSGKKGTRTTTKSTGKTAGKNTRTATKTTARSQAAAKPIREKYVPDEEDLRVRKEVILVVILAFSAILLLSNFGLCGRVGRVLSDVMFGIFGVYAYVFPMILLVGCAFLVSNIGSHKAKIKFLAGMLLLFVMCGIIQLYVDPVKDSLTVYYRDSVAHHTGGGFLGGLLAYSLPKAIGVVGAYVLLGCLALAAMIVITGKAVLGPMKQTGQKALETARQDVVRRKEENVKKRQEEALLRQMEEQEDLDDLDDLEAPRMSGDFPGMGSYGTGSWSEESDSASVRGTVSREGDHTYERNSGMHGIREDHGLSLNRTKITRGKNHEVHEIWAPEEANPAPRTEPQINEDIFKKFMETSQEEPIEDSHLEPIRQSSSLFDEISLSEPGVPFHKEQVTQKTGQLKSASNEIMDELDEEIEEGISRQLDQEGIGSQRSSEKPGSYDSEEEQLDEDGMFRPKERIQVSEQARETMARKPFSTAAAKVKVHTNGEGSKGDQREIPVPQVTEETGDLGLPMAPPRKKKEYVLPPLSLLTRPKQTPKTKASQNQLRETALKLQTTLQNFGVGVTITDVSRGPSVTRYELQPEQGTKVSRITSLADDIKLNLAASDIRIEAPIPGKAAVGIEVPNPGRDTVYFRELIESDQLKNHPSKLAFAAGKDIAGKVVVADIAKMPHMLIAGTTGSGKSVFTNSIIMSILYRAKPSEVRLIIVDPKVVEFGVYNGIPHLLIPVVTDPRKAAGALNWAVAEMSDRYKKFAELNVRDIKGYNQMLEKQKGDQVPQKMPQIVIIIDELADLMMAAAKEVEEAICRLAQLARAAGIHLVIATQRPSVDVVTGLIKANIPSRVALLVSSGTDSRTIIDMNGAEKLLGNGDMLFYPSGYVKPIRLQGAFISDGEVSKVVSYIKEQGAGEDYKSDMESRLNELPSLGGDGGDSDRDEYFDQAAKFVVEKQKASTSMLQRVFKIGFNRAARLMDQLAQEGIVGAEEGTKPRKVLMNQEEYQEYLEESE